MKVRLSPKGAATTEVRFPGHAPRSNHTTGDRTVCGSAHRRSLVSDWTLPLPTSGSHLSPGLRDTAQILQHQIWTSPKQFISGCRNCAIDRIGWMAKREQFRTREPRECNAGGPILRTRLYTRGGLAVTASNVQSRPIHPARIVRREKNGNVCYVFRLTKAAQRSRRYHHLLELRSFTGVSCSVGAFGQN